MVAVRPSWLVLLCVGLLSGCCLAHQESVSKAVKINSVHAQDRGVLVCYQVDWATMESIVVYPPAGIPQAGETWNLWYDYNGKHLGGKVADAPKDSPKP